MGWFFGCFGKGKKERKHGDAASLGKQKVAQKSSQTVPLRMPASASIPIKQSVREGSSREDLITVRQEMSGSCWAGKGHRESRHLPPLVSSSAPVRRDEGFLAQDPEHRVHGGSNVADSATENRNLPVGDSQTDPWAQLDQLEEELDDLRKQIERESHDANKIKDEVQLRKLGDQPQKTTLDFKKQEQQQHSERQKSPKGETNWHAWLSTSSSPTAKAQLEKNNENEDLHAYSCVPTPAKERPGLFQSMHTPVFKSLLTRRTQIKLDSATQAVIQAISGAPQQQYTGRTVDASSKVANESKSMVLEESSQKNLAASKGPAKSKLNVHASPDSQDLFEIRHDLLTRPDVLSFNTERQQQEQQPSKGIAVDAFRSNMLKVNDQPAPPDILPQEKGSSFDDDTDIKVVANNNSAKKRRLLSSECHEGSQIPKQSHVKADANDGGHEVIPRADSLSKRLKTFPSPGPATAPSYREDTPLNTEGVLTIHGLNSDSKQAFELHMKESTSGNAGKVCVDGKGNSQSNNKNRLNPLVQNRSEGRYQLHTMSPSESMSYCQTISTTLEDSMQTPVSRAKSVSFTTTCYPDETTETESYGNSVTTEDVSSEGDSCINSTSFEEGDQSCLDTSATQSYSYTGSEETTSGLAPVHCFSPPRSPAQLGRHAAGRDEGGQSGGSSDVDRERAAQYQVSASSRFSNHRVWKQGSEFAYEEDDHDLFSDAMSHVSTECSEDTANRRGRTDPLSSLNTQFSQLNRKSDTNAFAQRTPLKLSESIADPQTYGMGIAAKYARLRTKPTSSVLIPVQNLSQWNQLKEVHHDSERSTILRKASQMEKLEQNQLKHPLSAGLFPPSTAEDLKKKASNENKGEAAEADFIRVDTSLSHWLKPSPQQSETKKSKGYSAVGTGSFNPANHSRNQMPTKRLSWRDGIGMPISTTTSYNRIRQLTMESTPSLEKYPRNPAVLIEHT